MSAAAPLVRVERLSVVLRSPGRVFSALDDVSIELRPGELTALVGPSGAGKSTLARALLGLIDDSAEIRGRIEIAGQTLAPRDEHVWRELRGRTLALQFQDALATLDPRRGIGEQIAEGPREADGLRGEQLEARVQQVLERVGLGHEPRLRAAFAHQLSGGMRQRAALACALSREPKLLIADEPTSALDATLAVRIVELLAEQAHRHGLAVLWIAHDLAAAVTHADRIAVLDRGRLLECAPTRTWMREPRSEAGAALLVAARQRERVVTRSSAVAPGPALVTLEDVHVRRGATHALRGVSLELAPGSMTVVVGESGAGKSTLGGVLAGLLRPSAGRARLPVGPVGLVLQDAGASLDPRLTVAESLAEALAVARSPRAEFRARSLEWLERMGLSKEHLDALPQRLSGGERQRVALARALASGARLLVCDEVTSALDHVHAHAVVQRLMQACATEGVAACVITHDLALARALGGRTCVLYAGRIVEQGASAQVLARPGHPYTQALVEATYTLDGPPARALSGEPAPGSAVGRGCAFAPRCPRVVERCHEQAPPLLELAPGWRCACWLAEPFQPRGTSTP